MEKYIITQIFVTDGLERFMEIKSINNEKRFNIRMMEYNEYLEWGEKSQKRKEGDTIEGVLLIDALFRKKVDNTIMVAQNIPKSPNTVAIVEVIRIKDEYTIYAKSTIIEDEILVEFDQKVNCKKGDRILLEGSLELEIEE